MKLLELKKKIIYGPVHSRRLGESLGINLCPKGKKVCSFDCVYCQYGRTAVHTLEPVGLDFPNVEEVREAIREGMKEHQESVYVTFSGNGEPTLHPDFADLVDVVIELRDELLPNAQTAALSNGTALQFPKILNAMRKLDVPMIKLDAGNPDLFGRINRPCEGATFEKMIEGAKALPKLKTQSVLFDGPLQNHSGQPLDDWVGVLTELRPLEAQIYSTQRPVPDLNIKVIPPDRLQKIAEEAGRKAGVEVNAYF
ncbi:MAG: radical SAM protein [Methanomassiliicoccales archaeon]|nr:MAG: radical SAM protein [Methanomassiliicoccales archaeon]